LGVPAMPLGTVGGKTLQIKTSNANVNWELTQLHDIWWNTIARAMQ
jgi:hypothetical protein